jgi:hypothetical protein
VQDEFNPRNCCNKMDPCYPGLRLIRYRDIHPEFGNGPIDTVKLWAQVVAQCRKGGSDPDEIPIINDPSIGLQPSWSPIDIMCGGVARWVIRGSACGGAGTGVAEEPRILPFPRTPCPSQIPLRPTGTGG